MNTDKKSIDCFAEIKNTGITGLVGNQFVEDNVVVASDPVVSVTETAILKSETNEIFYFSLMKIKTGRKNNGVVEQLKLPE